MPKCKGRSLGSLTFEFTPMSHGVHIRIDDNDEPEFWCEIDVSLIELLAWCGQAKQLQIAAEAEVKAKLTPARPRRPDANVVE